MPRPIPLRYLPAPHGSQLLVDVRAKVNGRRLDRSIGGGGLDTALDAAR